MPNISPQSDFIQTLQTMVKQHSSFNVAFEHIQPIILAAFGAQSMSIFQRRSHHKDLVSRYHTSNEILELKVAINTQSIAGYVAMAQQAVKITNPYDDKALRRIHNKLRFDQKYDRLRHMRTDNILGVPIKYKGVLLGVLEIENKEVEELNDDDITLALNVSDIIGQAYRYQLGGTARAFDYLAHSGCLSAQILSEFSINASISQGTHQLKTKHNISEHLIYEALSVYFQVPFIDYLPRKYKLAQGNTKLSISYLKRNHVALVKDTLDRLIVVMYEPNNTDLVMEIESALGTQSYQLAFSLPGQILQYLEGNYNQTAPSKINEFSNKVALKKETHTFNDKAPEKESDIVKMVSNILIEAKRLNASVSI
jgi:hypothetical protein